MSKLDSQGRKVQGKYEIIEHTRTDGAKYWSVRRDGHTIPGRFSSVVTAEAAALNHKAKEFETKTRVVKEIT